jgi:hypothetical protein
LRHYSGTQPKTNSRDGYSSGRSQYWNDRIAVAISETSLFGTPLKNSFDESKANSRFLCTQRHMHQQETAKEPLMGLKQRGGRGIVAVV